MATIELESAPTASRHPSWLNWLQRVLHLHHRHRSRLRRRSRLQRQLADARQQRDLGVDPRREDRFDWMLQLSRRN